MDITLPEQVARANRIDGVAAVSSGIRIGTIPAAECKMPCERHGDEKFRGRRLGTERTDEPSPFAGDDGALLYSRPKQADFQCFDRTATRGDGHRVEQHFAMRLNGHEVHLDADRCGFWVAIVRVGEYERRLLLAWCTTSVGVDVECR